LPVGLKPVYNRKINKSSTRSGKSVLSYKLLEKGNYGYQW